MQLKYFEIKAWLAPHMDRLLGDVAVLHSPFFGSGKLEYYLAARRPGLEVRGVDAFEPVANLPPARTASLTDLQRWPGDGFFGQNTEVGKPTSV